MKPVYVFGPFRLDSEEEILFRGADPVALGRRAVAVLRVLLAQAGLPVSKSALIEAAWPGLAVEDSNLTVQIAALRRTLGGEAGGERWIQTLPRHGYRFVGPAVQTEPNNASVGSGVEAAPTLPDKPSIAVLPFQNMSGDPQREYLADGITDDIINGLSRLRWLFVIASHSTFTYKGKTTGLDQIARELGVRYVLEGSVRAADQRIRVTGKLIDVETGQHIWGERYDRPIENIFNVQDEITDSIVARLEPEISEAERERARRKPPEHFGAWDLYQHGMWHFLRHNPDGFHAARALFTQSIALDSSFAAAHAGLALVCFFLIVRGTAAISDAVFDDLLAEARMAATLDQRDPLARTALGLAFMQHNQLGDSIAEHQMAIELNPNSSFARWSFGYALFRADRPQEALKEFDLALRLSPRDPATWSYLTLKSGTLYQLGRYEEAVACARSAMRHPTADSAWPAVHLTAALGQLDRPDEAAAPIDRLVKRRLHFTVSDFRSWPHNRTRSPKALDHIIAGLHKAGVAD
ncbi:MAG TPA: winged helix-turn-helix domain-containing tetratricopeptide repeat protein [Pseudolabrys sp.]|nr:winged helix-turn-helix domain-containing tetratricopeptide repeat protein [Pseudolabrys sp.]